MIEYKKISVNSGLISLGNTGARVSDPRATYIKILKALVEFRKKNNNWEPKDQSEFGKLLSDRNIFEIKTDNKVSSDKDVRLKTSFLAQFGFTTDQRFITPAGKELLKHSLDFDTNEYDISNESFYIFKTISEISTKGF